MMLKSIPGSSSQISCFCFFQHTPVSHLWQINHRGKSLKKVPLLGTQTSLGNITLPQPCMACPSLLLSPHFLFSTFK